jgi:hypothetical protein
MLIACSTFSCALACAGGQSRETLRSLRMHGERNRREIVGTGKLFLF